MFWPSNYVDEGHDLTLEANLLSEAQMKKFAIKASKDRTIFKERALEIIGNERGFESEEYLKTTEKLARRMHKHNPRFEKKENICSDV